MTAPVFQDPWHAHVFALTVHLSEQEIFSWPEWTRTFGAVLAEHGLAAELDGGDDYFLAWVAALERILEDRCLASAGDLASLRLAWEEAYRNTPHGQPVRLAGT